MVQLGDLSPGGRIAVGVANPYLGLTLQRKSHILEDDKGDEESRRPPYKRRRWQLGMLMFILSNIVGSTIQITTLPLPVLSTLQASGLVFNTAFATVLLQEPFTRYSFFGTILTCGGAALIAIFGAFADPAHDLEQLLALLGRRQFIVWMVMTFLVAFATVALARFLKYLSPPSRHHQNGKLEHAPGQRRTSSTSTRARKSRVRTLSIPVPQSIQNVTPRAFRLRMLRGLSYGLISGILSAHSLLVAKSAVELIIRTLVDRNNQFNRYQSWLILLALIFLALSQLYYLHAGLRLCSTSVLYPFVFCIYNIIAILDGLIYFRQTSRLGPLHGGLIALGTVILLTGVVALSWRLDDTSPADPTATSTAQPPAPVTPLTPSLGFIPRDSTSSLLSSYGSDDEDDDEDTAILPARKRQRQRRRAHTTATAANESTPLLFDAHRRSIHDSGSNSQKARRRDNTLPMPTSPIPPRSPHSRSQIWRELDDEQPLRGDDDGSVDDEDYLASLPRVPSPWLSRDDARPGSAGRRGYGILSAGSGSQIYGRARSGSGSAADIGESGKGDGRLRGPGGRKPGTEERRSSAPNLVPRQKKKRGKVTKANGNANADANATSSADGAPDTTTEAQDEDGDGDGNNGGLPETTSRPQARRERGRSRSSFSSIGRGIAALWSRGRTKEDDDDRGDEERNDRRGDG
ncbi:MAG: hypothetical protein Q9160_001132 [Pyrenula sp. 1 TL-2023]